MIYRYFIWDAEASVPPETEYKLPLTPISKCTALTLHQTCHQIRKEIQNDKTLFPATVLAPYNHRNAVKDCVSNTQGFRRKIEKITLIAANASLIPGGDLPTIAFAPVVFAKLEQDPTTKALMSLGHKTEVVYRSEVVLEDWDGRFEWFMRRRYFVRRMEHRVGKYKLSMHASM